MQENSSKPLPHKFRPEIEGLRFFAIAPILIFHLSPALLPSGFIGVDIFFVISGYLITGLIIGRSHETGLWGFYVRRFFRLFPALLVTVLATLIAAWRIVGPADYATLAASSIASLFGAANFYFYATINYFNPASLDQPLLHIWSLAVEEQFYALWPLGLLLAHRRGLALPFCLLAAVLSIVAVETLRPHDPDLAFYMMPTRVFELGAGAAVKLLEMRGLAPGRSRAALLLGACGAMLLVYVFYSTNDETPWPGPVAVITCFGVALLIAGARHPIIERTLCFRPLRFFGSISYSLYLVHWPVIALHRQLTVVEPQTSTLVGLAALSIALGWLLHVAIEVPFRDGWKPGTGELGARYRAVVGWLHPDRRRRAYVVVGAAAATLVLTLAIVLTGGFPSRAERGTTAGRDKGLTFAGDLCDQRRAVCLFGDRQALRTVYLVGDSHALNLIYGLDGLFKRHRVKGIAITDHGCLFLRGTARYLRGTLDKKCASNVALAYETLAATGDPIIYTGAYGSYAGSIGPSDAGAPLPLKGDEFVTWFGERLAAGFKSIAAPDRPIVVLKSSYDTGANLAKCWSAGGAVQAGACRAQSRHAALAKARKVDEQLEIVASVTPGVTLVDPKDAFCRSEECQVSGPEGLYFRDSEHLTNAGSAFLIERLEGDLLRALKLEQVDRDRSGS